MFYDRNTYGESGHDKGWSRIEKLNKSNWVRWNKAFMAYVIGLDRHIQKYLETGIEPDFEEPTKDDLIEVLRGRTLIKVKKYEDNSKGEKQLKRL